MKLSYLFILFVIAVLFISCEKKKPLGNNYFVQGDKILYQYQSAGNSWPKVPWDNKYKLVNNADAKTFAIIKATGFAKDKSHYFYKGEMLPNIDYATFEVIDYGIEGIVKDKKQVYKFKEPQKIIEGADPKTYAISAYPQGSVHWFKDANNYFLQDKLMSVDANTFKPIDGNEKFYIDKNYIYALRSDYKNTYLESIFCPGLINQSIKIDDNRMIETDNALFCTTRKGKLVKIPFQNKSAIQYFAPDHTFMIIDKQVYCEGELLSNVDFETFSVYEFPKGSFTSYAKDKNNVYYYNEILQDADPNIVKLVNGNIEDDTYKWVIEPNSSVITVRKKLKKSLK